MASPSRSDAEGPFRSLELHIIELLRELTAAIGALCDDGDEEELPLAEFDQRLLLEHVQVIERYVLAQAAGRLMPEQFRLIGRPLPGAALGEPPSNRPAGNDSSALGRDLHEGSHGPSHDHPHPHEPGPSHEHHVADPVAAREAHRQGRAIIGEHPWEQGHSHDDSHPDEWEWEPIDPRG